MRASRPLTTRCCLQTWRSAAGARGGEGRGGERYADGASWMKPWHALALNTGRSSKLQAQARGFLSRATRPTPPQPISGPPRVALGAGSEYRRSPSDPQVRLDVVFAMTISSASPLIARQKARADCDAPRGLAPPRASRRSLPASKLNPHLNRESKSRPNGTLFPIGRLPLWASVYGRMCKAHRVTSHHPPTDPSPSDGGSAEALGVGRGIRRTPGTSADAPDLLARRGFRTPDIKSQIRLGSDAARRQLQRYRFRRVLYGVGTRQTWARRACDSRYSLSYIGHSRSRMQSAHSGKVRRPGSHGR